MAANISWHASALLKTPNHDSRLPAGKHLRYPVKAFRCSDVDGFAKRMASGEAWRNVWRSANDGLEQLVFEAKKVTERIDRRYAFSRRLTSAARSSADRARQLDREFEITQRWRTFSIDFSRNWPRYRRQLIEFLYTPLGRSFSTIFFLWFVLSGWLFRFLMIATWVLPFAGPLVIKTVANNFIIQGACPACRRQFSGYKNQVVRCEGCGNIVWKPKSRGDFFSGNGSRSGSKADIIDVEFEEK